MPSPFAIMARAALQPAYAHHAQTFAWTPMRASADVNAPAEPDPTRVAGDVSGCLFDKPAPAAYANAYDHRADQRPGFSGNIPRIEFPPPVEGAPPDVRRLDLLTDENGATWRVVSTKNLKSGVLSCEVNVT
jgi:hypothetical protein